MDGDGGNRETYAVGCEVVGLRVLNLYIFTTCVHEKKINVELIS